MLYHFIQTVLQQYQYLHRTKHTHR